MKNNPRKVLIIKTGFSEFLDRGVSTTVSLGDVLLCTVILHLFKNDRVTWVTSWAARQLLAGNPYIHETLIFGPDTFRKISRRSFDILINLEKDIGLSAYSSQVKSKKRFGFYFNLKDHDISTYEEATKYLLSGQEHHNHIHKTFFHILFEALGARWRGERPVLNRDSRRQDKTDIGFNYAVGSKWPTKAWPMGRWKELEKELKKDFSVSWQKGHKNLDTYIDWINSCKLIVTSDSLGQVIGHALDKKIVTLYGPTNYRRMSGIDQITLVPSKTKCPHMPCYLPVCQHDRFCMEEILARDVAAICRRLLS